MKKQVLTMKQTEIEEKYMARCIQLARGGVGHTSPNPMVGAVVVHSGRIIGEGYHRKCGEAHAEVNAIASVREQDRSLLKDSTIYVSLEPCSHYGKTPPCAELIVKTDIPRVVVGCLDPFPQVSGRGVRMLREAGVEVITGVMEAECKALNRAFMTMQTAHRPYVILKWAQSADGFLDRVRTSAEEPPVVLSSAETLRRVHRLRTEVRAILVGTRTALLDNPSLTVRHWEGPSPLRIALDRSLKIPATHHLLDGTVPTLILTEKAVESRANVSYVQVDFNRPLAAPVMAVLAERKIDSLLVEGGTRLLQTFLSEGLWDEARVETAPVSLGEGVPAPRLEEAVLREAITTREGHVIEAFNHLK